MIGVSGYRYTQRFQFLMFTGTWLYIVLHISSGEAVSGQHDYCHVISLAKIFHNFLRSKFYSNLSLGKTSKLFKI